MFFTKEEFLIKLSKLIPAILLGALILFLAGYSYFLHQEILKLTPVMYTPKSEINNNQKVVYFTFDADMTPYMKKELQTGKVSTWYSQKLVSYIEDQKIPATIFTTGMFAEIYPSIIKGLAQIPGVEIANHSYDHPGFERPCYGLATISSDKSKTDEMQKTQIILDSLAGYAPKYFRHPGLCHNAHDDALAKNLGLAVSDNGLISGDAFNTNKYSIEKNVLKNVHNGSVIIMHLGGPHAPATEPAFEYIVAALKKQNYTFKSL